MRIIRRTTGNLKIEAITASIPDIAARSSRRRAHARQATLPLLSKQNFPIEKERERKMKIERYQRARGRERTGDFVAIVDLVSSLVWLARISIFHERIDRALSHPRSHTHTHTLRVYVSAESPRVRRGYTSANGRRAGHSRWKKEKKKGENWRAHVALQ